MGYSRQKGEEAGWDRKHGGGGLGTHGWKSGLFPWLWGYRNGVATKVMTEQTRSAEGPEPGSPFSRAQGSSPKVGVSHHCSCEHQTLLSPGPQLDPSLSGNDLIVPVSPGPAQDFHLHPDGLSNSQVHPSKSTHAST